MIEAGTAFSARRVHLADVAKAGETATRTTIYSTASTSGVVWVLKPGQEEPIAKGDVIVSAKGACHGMRNTGTEDFVFVGILAPLPADYYPIEG